MKKSYYYYLRSIGYWIISMVFLFLAIYGLTGNFQRSLLILLAFILFLWTNNHAFMNSDIGRQWKAKETFDEKPN